MTHDHKNAGTSDHDRKPIEHPTAPGEQEPGSRSGLGARSLWAHLAADAKRKGPEAADPPVMVPDRSRFTVLVVDDTESARYAIARALRAAGYRTIEAASGAEALQLASAAAAVVLEVHLPDLHGIEVCRMVRNNPKTRDLPVIHVSAMEIDQHHVQAGRDAGADMYMIAPVPPGDLTEAIDKLISRAPGSSLPG